MNLKRHSVLLALLLLTALLTACARHTEKPAEDAPPLQGQDNVSENGAADGAGGAATEEALWTAAEIRSLFEEKTAGKGYTALSCVPADDGAYGLAGVVLYTTAEGDRTNLAFLGDDGYYQTCGVMALPWEDGNLSYQGDGAVTFQVLGQGGSALDYQMSISIDGANVHFDVASDAVDS